jgi:hypothetical protein
MNDREVSDLSEKDQWRDYERLCRKKLTRDCLARESITLAASRGYLHFIVYWLDFFDDRLCYKDLRQALEIACGRGYTEIVRKIIARKPELVTFEALLMACTFGNVWTAQLLLDCGASPELVDSEGNTVLMRACQFRRSDVVVMLVKRGVSVTARNDRGRTALEESDIALLAKACSEHRDIFHEEWESKTLEIFDENGMMPRGRQRCGCLWPNQSLYLAPITRDAFFLPLVLDIAIAFAAMRLPPYVLLEIVDWLTMQCGFRELAVADVARIKKVRILESVQRFQNRLQRLERCCH